MQMVPFGIPIVLILMIHIPVVGGTFIGIYLRAQVIMEIGRLKENVLIFNHFLLRRDATSSLTTEGSARVETSPS